jgi:uncharacterized protein (TIGR02145 family)
MKKALCFLSLIFLSISVSAQEHSNIVAEKSILSTSITKQGYPTFTADEIKKISVFNDGYTVFNTTTGCINYYFDSNWFEICGTCIPKYSKPKISRISSLAYGNEIELADSFRYLAVLFPDSELVTAFGKTIIVNAPKHFDGKKKYPLKIYNLSDPCKNRPILDTFVTFPSNVVRQTSNSSVKTVSTGSHLWLSEPSVEYVNDEKVCIKLNGKVYYNWRSLNKDPFSESKSAPYYSKNVCPSGYRIPSVNDVETLIEYNKQETVFEKFELGKSGFVVNAQEKKEEPTDDRFIFMLKDSDHPEAFQALLITNSDIRIARLPRDVYVRILCVSE